MNATILKQQKLETLYSPLKECKGCHFKMPLATQLVFGMGTPDAPLVFIGEAPGEQEDLQGKPFVGRSGRLLDKILESLDTNRNQFYITNIVKSRPPNNRKPLPAEMARSRDFLLKQLAIINPKAICTLGSAALEGLMQEPVQITKKRGKTILFQGIPVIPAYHPAYILRNPKELPTLVQDITSAIELALGGG